MGAGAVVSVAPTRAVETMRRSSVMRSLSAIVVLAVLAAACTVSAQVPQRINYQVMLTDDTDQSLADQAVQLVFRIYESESGGAQLWSETHNVTTNSIGVVTVTLGETTPLSLDFNGPLWLQVEADGEVLSPRRELMSAPYALGMEDVGVGDGYSLDAEGGSPADVVYVDPFGRVQVGTGVPVFGELGTLDVAAPDGSAGVRVTTDGNGASDSGIFVHSESASGLVSNVNYGPSATAYILTPTGVVGMGLGDAWGGYFTAGGSGCGAYSSSHGAGSAFKAHAYADGYSGEFEGGAGVSVTGDASFPLLDVSSQLSGDFGDVARFESADGALPTTYTLYSCCYAGQAGRFRKYTDDGDYAVRIFGVDAASPGLYVSGTVFSTGLVSRGVATSRGTEPVFSVASESVDIVASGKGQLSEGRARVSFSRLYSESLGDPSELRITATPVGGWSALYVASVDRSGFELRSASGDPDVHFDWVALGPDGGHERRPAVSMPDPAEDARIERLKNEQIQSRRAQRQEPPKEIIVTR
jgi:hypothetical protein